MSFMENGKNNAEITDRIKGVDWREGQENENEKRK